VVASPFRIRKNMPKKKAGEEDVEDGVTDSEVNSEVLEVDSEKSR